MHIKSSYIICTSPNLWFLFSRGIDQLSEIFAKSWAVVMLYDINHRDINWSNHTVLFPFFCSLSNYLFNITLLVYEPTWQHPGYSDHYLITSNIADSSRESNLNRKWVFTCNFSKVDLPSLVDYVLKTSFYSYLTSTNVDVVWPEL